MKDLCLMLTIVATRIAAGMMFLISVVPFVRNTLGVVYSLLNESRGSVSQAFEHFVWASVPLALSLILGVLAQIASHRENDRQHVTPAEQQH